MTTKKLQLNYKRIICQFSVIFALTGIDQLIKFFVERDLRPLGSADVIPGFFGLLYLQNTGAAFSFMSDKTGLLSLITGAALIFLMIFLIFTKMEDRIFHVLLPLIISGGLGNLLDRIIRGYVVDYIELQFVRFAIFNFADILITCSTIVLIAYLIYGLIQETRKPELGDEAT